MSYIDEIYTSRLGWPTLGPIEQIGDHRRAAICFGNPVDRPDRRTIWCDSREELLALYNAVGHQLARWDDMDRQRVMAAHPSQPSPEPALAAAAPPEAADPLSRGPFEPVAQSQPVAAPELAVASAVPVPPSVTAIAEAGQRSVVRPYVYAVTPAAPAAEVVPDPHRPAAEQ
ncbi:hypothetical protein FHS43_000539 [Streptosporangium becharense]|uniref:Uncharacterized protein n=1 Tax=Streptosporangium becharense TaxID=1816182 RepID=A0A7W9IN57_9ACTN|nr:hypothetical protein [Streptosporangium becharense]MBB2909293.1 hypothetical protein [Streptosporangium becharense]MBB5823804.1 hypothetical protein [Streptosporangium becharense]